METVATDAEFDLFGNPYRRKNVGGRPAHMPTEESVIDVMILLASGTPNKDIAEQLGIDVKTLRHHYGHLGKDPAVVLMRLKTKLRTEQIRLGLKGNASALANAIKMLEGIDAERVAKNLRDKAANQPTARGYVSKKERRLESARQIGGKYAPPQPPRLVSNNGQALAADNGDD